MALDDFAKRLRPRFGHRVARRHAVADVEVADDIDRKPDFLAIVHADEGQGADTAFHIARIVLDQYLRANARIRVVENLQFRRQQFLRPIAIFIRLKPALLWVMRKVMRGKLFAQVIMCPEVITGKALKEFAKRAGQRSEL